MRRLVLLLTVAAVLGLVGVALAGDTCATHCVRGYVPAAAVHAPGPAYHETHEVVEQYLTFFAFVGAPSSPAPVTISQDAYRAEQARTQAVTDQTSGVAGELRALRTEVAALRAGPAAAADLPPPVPGAVRDAPPPVPGAAPASPSALTARAGIAEAAGLLQHYCAQCHSGAAARGPRRAGPVQLFDDRGAFALRGTTRPAVAQVLEDGDMPPQAQPQPAAAERGALLAWLRN